MTPPVRTPTATAMALRTALILLIFVVGFTGLLAAALGYALTMTYWRWWVGHNWRKRQKARRQR